MYRVGLSSAQRYAAMADRVQLLPHFCEREGLELQIYLSFVVALRLAY